MKKSLPFSVILGCFLFFQCSNNNSRLDNSTSAVRQDSLKLYFIALEDSGKSGKLIGCNDSAVPVWISVTDTANPVNTALYILLNVHSRTFQDTDLYNPLYQSDLTFSHIHNMNTVTKVFLKGEIRIGGICDNPRVQSQLRLTVQQFDTVGSVAIYINSAPLDEILSLR